MEQLELRQRAGTDRKTDTGRVSEGGGGEPNCQEMGMAGMRRDYRNHVRRTAERVLMGKATQVEGRRGGGKEERPPRG